MTGLPIKKDPRVPQTHCSQQRLQKKQVAVRHNRDRLTRLPISTLIFPDRTKPNAREEMKRIIKQVEQSQQPLAHNVAIALLFNIGKHGIKQISIDLKNTIVAAIETASLSAKHIGNICYGLKNLDGSQESTRELVAALAVKITESTAILGAQHIGMACYGLQNLDGSSDSTKALVTALLSKLPKPSSEKTPPPSPIHQLVALITQGSNFQALYTHNKEQKILLHSQFLAFLASPIAAQTQAAIQKIIARWITDEKLPVQNGDAVDLHSHVPGSVKPFLDHMFALSRNKPLTVIVGQGIHSQHGHSISRAVQEHYSVQTPNMEGNSGRWTISKKSPVTDTTPQETHKEEETTGTNEISGEPPIQCTLVCGNQEWLWFSCAL